MFEKRRCAGRRWRGMHPDRAKSSSFGDKASIFMPSILHISNRSTFQKKYFASFHSPRPVYFCQSKELYGILLYNIELRNINSQFEFSDPHTILWSEQNELAWIYFDFWFLIFLFNFLSTYCQPKCLEPSLFRNGILEWWRSNVSHTS